MAWGEWPERQLELDSPEAQLTEALGAVHEVADRASALVDAMRRHSTVHVHEDEFCVDCAVDALEEALGLLEGVEK